MLLINYAIIPIRWLIAGSSSTFLLQISSFTTLAATGRVEISDSANSCMTLHGRFTTGNIVGHQQLAPPGITTSVVSSCGLTGKSGHWFPASYHHWTVTLVWISSRSHFSSATSVSTHDRGCRAKWSGEYEECKVWLCWSLECLIVRPASNPDGCLIRPEENSWNPKSDSEAWEQSRKWRPVSLIKTTMHFNSVVIKF